MNFESSRESVAVYFGHPDQSADTARNYLTLYHNGRPDLLPEGEAVIPIYLALQTLLCEGMADNHRNDPKRLDRLNGRERSQLRDRSRRR